MGRGVRYIIDHYSVPLPDGSPVFNLDMWLALNSVTDIQAHANGWKKNLNNAATRESQA